MSTIQRSPYHLRWTLKTWPKVGRVPRVNLVRNEGAWLTTMLHTGLIMNTKDMRAKVEKLLPSDFFMISDSADDTF